jgi:hypothetical protein
VLLRGSEESVERKTAIIGAVTLVCIVLVGYLAASGLVGGRPQDRIDVTIGTPFVGEGVTDGTAIFMHGVEVGKVRNVTSVRGSGFELLAELQKTPVAGLTDTMKIDFRPANYFGVTAINVVASAGGEPLRDGMRVNVVPQGNSTLQALLSRLGEVSAAALTPQLISVIDRTVRYTDALNPLVETLLLALDAVADVQTEPTSRLLANTTGIAVAFPSWVDAVGDAGDNIAFSGGFGKLSEQFWRDVPYAALKMASTDLFGTIGRLESNYIDDLLPAVDSVKLLSDTVPALVRPVEFSHTLTELRNRLERMFAGSPEQRALQVRIVLDSIPGVAAPLGVMGAPQ